MNFFDLEASNYVFFTNLFLLLIFNSFLDLCNQIILCIQEEYLEFSTSRWLNLTGFRDDLYIYNYPNDFEPDGSPFVSKSIGKLCINSDLNCINLGKLYQILTWLFDLIWRHRGRNVFALVWSCSKRNKMLIFS